jgi:Na+-driven multidrug efflux pump
MSTNKDDDYKKVTSGGEFKTFESMKQLGSLAVMPIVGSLMMPFFSILNTAVCGYLSEANVLAGYGLGSLVLSVFGTAMLVQLSSIQTVVGQANGSRDFHLARVFLHR